MGEALTSVIHIKNYLNNQKYNYMAEKSKDKKDSKPKPKKHNSGEMSFGMEIVIFLVIIFAIWILMGKSDTKNVTEEKPFVKVNSSLPQ